MSRTNPPSTDSTADEALKLQLSVPVAFRRLDAAADVARVTASLGSNVRVFQACDLLTERPPANRNEVDPAVVTELRRIDLKMTLMLDLLADLFAETHPPPPTAEIVLDFHGLDWVDAPADLTVGDRGVVEIYIQAGVPRPLRFIAHVAAAASSQRRFEFEGLSAAEADQLERLIFRQHRQKIAGSRGLQG